MRFFLQICKLLAGGWIILVAELGVKGAAWMDAVSFLIGAVLIVMALWNIVRILKKKPLVGEK